MDRSGTSIALEYFQKKFSICTLTDAKRKSNNNIFNKRKHEKV